jgi:hypothetical protein
MASVDSTAASNATLQQQSVDATNVAKQMTQFASFCAPTAVCHQRPDALLGTRNQLC